jgi:hypothetical protein
MISKDPSGQTSKNTSRLRIYFQKNDGISLITFQNGQCYFIQATHTRHEKKKFRTLNLVTLE